MAKIGYSIDFGTGNIRIGAMEGEYPKVLRTAEGDTLTPSVFAVTRDGKELCGISALLQSWVNPRGTCFHVKLRLGEEKPIELQRQKFSPVEIAARLVEHALRSVRERTGRQIEEAVWTCPAHWFGTDEAPRLQALREVAELVGVKVVQLLAEPAAAAIARGLPTKGYRKILVADFGHGTVDYTVLETARGLCTTRGTCGAPVGGWEITQAVVDELIQRVPNATLKDLATLTEEAERAKRYLSHAGHYQVAVRLSSGMFTAHLTRRQFEEKVGEVVERALEPLPTALGAAQVALDELDEVLLVGGSSRLPLYRKRLAAIVNQQPLLATSPEELVAVGGAFVADAAIHQKPLSTTANTVALSIKAVVGKEVKTLMPAGTLYPARGETMFELRGTPGVNVFIRQGESESPERLLRMVTVPLEFPHVTGKTVIRLAVEATLDINGILRVFVRDEHNPASRSSASSTTALPTAEEIQRFRYTKEGS